MFKQLFTLTRGHVTDGAQAILDRDAVALLRQQMRDAAKGVETSRRAVAVLMAYEEREKASLSKIKIQMADLEGRALKALTINREDLACEAANTIAQLQAEHDTTQLAIKTFQTKITHLKKALTENETCLRDLKRGQYLAEANGKTQCLDRDITHKADNVLKEAQTTLKRLQQRQDHAAATATAMAELSVASTAEEMAKHLAEQGCGAPLKPDAATVLEQLKAKAAK